MLRRLSDRLAGTALDRAVRHATRDPRRDFLFCWNRGLGDIALCLVPIFARVRRDVPGARIVVVTRPELLEPFRMTDVDDAHAIPGLARDALISVDDIRMLVGLEPDRFAAVFTYPDPNRWLRGRRTEFPPSLRWDPEWDARAERFVHVSEDRIVVGAHVNSETASFYSYSKDWPAQRWHELFARFGDAPAVHWVLFGNSPEPRYVLPNVTDLRGRTGFLDLASVIRNRCRVLVAPDSGVLSTAYYLAASFPLDVISLWSDPRQGILLQGCPSPNPLLRHVALIGRDEQARNISVGDVESALRTALAGVR
jgi:ADP-heptose:LPS heptosyltransferase